MLEVEIKLPVKDPDRIGILLNRAGFAWKEERTEEDTYYDNEESFIRENGYAFRIRRTVWPDTGKKEATVNFKGKKTDAVSVTREELETGIEDADIMDAIIRSLGYSGRGPVVFKRRTVYRKDGMEACMDDVKGLGTFLELEILSEKDGYEDAMDRIGEMLRFLGYGFGDTVRTSYLSMLQGKKDEK